MSIYIEIRLIDKYCPLCEEAGHDYNNPSYSLHSTV